MFKSTVSYHYFISILLLKAKIKAKFKVVPIKSNDSYMITLCGPIRIKSYTRGAT